MKNEMIVKSECTHSHILHPLCAKLTISSKCVHVAGLVTLIALGIVTLGIGPLVIFGVYNAFFKKSPDSTHSEAILGKVKVQKISRTQAGSQDAPPTNSDVTPPVNLNVIISSSTALSENATSLLQKIEENFEMGNSKKEGWISLEVSKARIKELDELLSNDEISFWMEARPGHVIIGHKTSTPEQYLEIEKQKGKSAIISNVHTKLANKKFDEACKAFNQKQHTLPKMDVTNSFGVDYSSGFFEKLKIAHSDFQTKFLKNPDKKDSFLASIFNVEGFASPDKAKIILSHLCKAGLILSGKFENGYFYIQFDEMQPSCEEATSNASSDSLMSGAPQHFIPQFLPNSSGGK